MQNIIFHADVNSAFLSWSAVKILSENPDAVDLRKVPSAVGGNTSTRHGIITAKSIPAKKYGIETAMPVVKALGLCPELIIVEADFWTYRRYSKAFIDILKKYANVVEQFSIDEAFLDMTGRTSNPEETARKIADEVKYELGFTINIGVSTNKLLAKMASDFKKPDMVHTLYPEEIPDKMWPLPIADLFGCGAKTAEKLEKIGIKTIGNAAHTEPKILIGQLGKISGNYIYEAANGKSESVVSDEERDPKSVGNELTTTVDIGRENLETEGVKVLKYLSVKVSERLKKQGLYAGTITFGVKTDDFKRHSVQTKLPDSTRDASIIFDTAKELMKEMLLKSGGIFDEGKKIRLMSVSASTLDNGEFRQINFNEYEKMKALSDMTEKIKRNFGDNAIYKGSKK